MKYNKNDISPPAAKTLEVLEYFSFFQGKITLKQVAEATGISQATLLRILNTFIAYGYIAKNSEKKYIANFKLAKSDTIPAYLDSALNDSLERLVKNTGQSAEIITVKGDKLFWYNKKEPENMQIRINARAGFKRSIYELDAPSRLYLKSLREKQAAECFSTDAFYDIDYKGCSWSEAVGIWSVENINQVTYDKHGNSNGVRRYAALVNDETGGFLFILSVAEAAIPRNNTSEHVDKVISAIETEKNIITGIVSNENSLFRSGHTAS